MAPQSAQTDATRSRDILLYVMKKTLSVVVGGHVVEVVAVVHEDVGALLNSAKFKKIGVKLVTSHQLYRAVNST